MCRFLWGEFTGTGTSEDSLILLIPHLKFSFAVREMSAQLSPKADIIAH
jgi:hypothetical protein